MRETSLASMPRDFTSAYFAHLLPIQNPFTYIRDFLPRRDRREKRALKPQLTCRAVQTRLRPSPTHTHAHAGAAATLHQLRINTASDSGQTAGLSGRGR
jgi:hypothetical protein